MATNTTALEALMAKADGHFGRGEFAEARVTLRLALEQEPESPEATLALGFTHFQLGDLDAARIAFSKATQLAPNNLAAHTNLAVILRQLGLPEQSESSALRALALKPGDSALLQLLAGVYFDSGRYGEAARAYHELLQQWPNDGNTLLAIGNCFFKAGDFLTARDAFKMALEVDSQNSVARENLAVVEQEMQRANEKLDPRAPNRFATADFSPELGQWLNNASIAVAQANWPAALNSYVRALRAVSADHLLAPTLIDKVSHLESLIRPAAANSSAAHFSTSPLIHARLCREAEFTAPWFKEICGALKLSAEQFNRKYWEFCFIVQELEKRGSLQAGRKALGFGVGREHLVSYFAHRGCNVLATDLAVGEAAKSGWVETYQHSARVEDLLMPELCDAERFKRQVEFREVDMNRLPEDLLSGQFDFTWSTGSFEHLGSLDQSRNFLLAQMRCLKPGGVAVHTTEFNLSSNETTAERGSTVLFRRCDLETLAAELARQWEIPAQAIQLDFDPGSGRADSYVDLPPYATHRQTNHLKLLIGNFVCTSVGIVIQRPL